MADAFFGACWHRLQLTCCQTRKKRWSLEKEAMSVEEILLAEMNTGMLDGDCVPTPMAKEARAMRELNCTPSYQGVGQKRSQGQLLMIVLVRRMT
jgi:hypothetical protein